MHVVVLERMSQLVEARLVDATHTSFSQKMNTCLPTHTGTMLLTRTYNHGLQLPSELINNAKMFLVLFYLHTIVGIIRGDHRLR